MLAPSRVKTQMPSTNRGRSAPMRARTASLVAIDGAADHGERHQIVAYNVVNASCEHARERQRALLRFAPGERCLARGIAGDVEHERQAEGEHEKRKSKPDRGAKPNEASPAKVATETQRRGPPAHGFARRGDGVRHIVVRHGGSRRNVPNTKPGAGFRKVHADVIRT